MPMATATKVLDVLIRVVLVCGRAEYTRSDLEATTLGRFENDKKSGEGTKSYINGDRYEGQWLNDEQNGKGLTPLYRSMHFFVGIFHRAQGQLRSIQVRHTTTRTSSRLN